MASNADLIAAAKALGERLGEEVETTDLTNKELVTLVSGLRERADTVDRASSAEGSTAALVAQADGLAEQLGTTVETEGKSDTELQELIDGMKVGVDEAAKAQVDAQGADAATKAKEEADAIAAQKVKDAAKAEKKKPPYYIMPGKALTSKRGILGPGDAIAPDDIAGGEDALRKFVKSGHVGKG